MNTSDFETRLKTLLAEQHDWPCMYCFKFIVEIEQMHAVKALFPGETPILRPSAKGAYVGVTFHFQQESPASVVAIYAAAAKIPGLIAL